MAESLAFAATCGVTFMERSSLTKSSVSKPLSAPTVIRHGLSARGSNMASAAHRKNRFAGFATLLGNAVRISAATCNMLIAQEQPG
jgi:hypothetical protein